MREDVYGIIARQRPKPDPELSPRWRESRRLTGALGRNCRSGLPGRPGWWRCGMYAWTLFGLNDGSDALYRADHGSPSRPDANDRACCPGPAACAGTCSGATRRVGQVARLPAARDRARSGHGARNRRGARGAGPQSRHVHCRQCGVGVEIQPVAGTDRTGARGGTRLRSGDRIYRQPADPLVAISLELPTVRGAGEVGGGDYR